MKLKGEAMKLMKKVYKVLGVVGLMLLSTSLCFASTGGSISATDSEAKTDVGGSHLLLINDGANEVFIAIRARNSAAVAATTSSFELKSGESTILDSYRGFDQVSTVCSSAETATVRFLSWD